MSCQSSQVVLGTVTLDLDPEAYTPLAGARRGAIYRLIDGTRLFQDRGYTLSGDGIVLLKGKLINLSTVQALLVMYQLQGGIFTLTDYKDNQFDVLFTPGKESLTFTPITGSGRGWEYQMDLTIVSATKILGIPV